jgi:hypothetical protein
LDCSDSRNTTFLDLNGTNQTCYWLTQHPAIIPDVCNLSWTEAMHVCPQTCGVCVSQQEAACGDDDQTPFVLEGQLYDCEWLRVNLVVSGGAFKGSLCPRRRSQRDLSTNVWNLQCLLRFGCDPNTHHTDQSSHPLTHCDTPFLVGVLDSILHTHSFLRTGS